MVAKSVLVSTWVVPLTGRSTLGCIQEENDTSVPVRASMKEGMMTRMKRSAWTISHIGWWMGRTRGNHRVTQLGQSRTSVYSMCMIRCSSLRPVLCIKKTFLVFLLSLIFARLEQLCPNFPLK